MLIGFRHALPIALIAFAANGLAGPVPTAPRNSVIGMVSASGHVRVDRSQVWGNATVFEGTSIETDAASGSVALRNGVRIQLASKSRALFWQDRAKLEKGTSQFTVPAAYDVETGGFRVRAEAGTRMLVAFKPGNHLEVTALAGEARVNNARGSLLATIPAGHSAGFALQQGAAAPVTHSGCLLYKDGHYILQDEMTSEVIELNGSDLALNVGNRVEVTGPTTTTKPTVSIATSVMDVTNLSPRATGGCLTVASALGASANPPPAAGAAPTPAVPAAKGGLSKGAKIGIAVAAIGGGAGAAIAIAGSKSSTSP